MLGASGVVESAVSIARPANAACCRPPNLSDPDPDCDLDHLRRPAPDGSSTCMSNSFGFGGHNVSLILGKAAAVASS